MSSFLFSLRTAEIQMITPAPPHSISFFVPEYERENEKNTGYAGQLI
ncbi:MAG TPA: hypothetical protein GX704_00605 [Clostridiales bacterium]|jgi:hypothetical protein|nr:hypothetical protein [Clostridiales bacterium]